MITIQSMQQLLESGTHDSIISAMELALKNVGDSPFWISKSEPLASAVLSVLIPLREQNLLFNPEGQKVENLDVALVIRWCDLMSLKMLYFTLKKSNKEGALLRTKLDLEEAKTYKSVDIEALGQYLLLQTVNLEDEILDFPISNYNIHIGVSEVIEKVLQ